MVLVRLIILVVFFCSCKGNSTQTNQEVNSEEKWVLSSQVFSNHTYTPSGLINTSFKTLYYYISGEIADSVKSKIVRKYEDSVLTKEQEFIVSEDGSEKLSSETINQYDLKGNLILTKVNVQNNFISKTINEYNDKKQILKSIDFTQEIEQNSNDGNIDSVVAQSKGKKLYQYDTTITNYTYDSEGNLIQTVKRNTKGGILKTWVYHFNGNEPTFSFSLNPLGDTVLKVEYDHQGKFTKEIHTLKELGNVDTTWKENKKILKIIGHNFRTNTKYRFIYKYNAKGQELESSSYK